MNYWIFRFIFVGLLILFLYMSKFYTLSDSVISTIKTLQEQLWKLINSSPSYSFVREPLPVFYLLLARYSNQDVRITGNDVKRYLGNLGFDYPTDRDDLLDNFPKSCEKVLIREKEIFKPFFELITDGCYGESKEECTGVITHGLYKYIHKELVEFFISKYSDLSHSVCVLPEDVMFNLFYECNDDGNEDCLSSSAPVYIPFSGSSSYFLYAMEERHSFMDHCYNEEPNENLAFMAKVRMNAWGYPSKIVSHSDPASFTESDPLKKWDWAKDWAMVSIPPFGLKVKQKGENGHIDEIDVAEFLINRFLEDENIRTAYLVLPLSFCYSPSFEHLRKKVVENKYLRGVVEIPAKSFKTTSIATVMISLNKYGSDAIDFGDINKKNGNGFLDTIKVDNSAIVSNNYLIVPSLYMDKELVLKDGQVAMALGDIVEISKSVKLTSSEEIIILDDSDFCNSTDDLFAERNLQHGLPQDNMKCYSGRCLVLKKRLNGIAVCPVEGNFATSPSCLVLKMKDDMTMSLNYFAHCLLECGQIGTISSYGVQLNKTIAELMLNVKLPLYATSNMQEASMVTLKDQYIQRKEREFRTEMERYGIRAASSDLNHMLAPTYSRIKNILNRFEDGDKSLVESIRDNMDYMNRMIKHAGIDFNSYQPALKELEINKFFQEHIDACRNLCTTSFQVNYTTSMDDDTTISIDDDMFKYLLDTILENVYRHGFEEREIAGGMVHISTTPTLIDDNPYLLLSIANNGKPLSEDFSIEKFIGRGECCGETKHTGLGGYHIYHIVKSHNGYMNITGTSAWPVIYEILIPITNSFEDENLLLTYDNRANCI